MPHLDVLWRSQMTIAYIRATLHYHQIPPGSANPRHPRAAKGTNQLQHKNDNTCKTNTATTSLWRPRSFKSNYCFSSWFPSVPPSPPVPKIKFRGLVEWRFHRPDVLLVTEHWREHKALTLTSDLVSFFLHPQPDSWRKGVALIKPHLWRPHQERTTSLYYFQIKTSEFSISATNGATLTRGCRLRKDAVDLVLFFVWQMTDTCSQLWWTSCIIINNTFTVSPG